VFDLLTKVVQGRHAYCRVHLLLPVETVELRLVVIVMLRDDLSKKSGVARQRQMLGSVLYKKNM